MKICFKYLLLLLLPFASTKLYAQASRQGKIDSLLSELPKQKEDTNKVNVLNGLAETYLKVNLEVGIKYAHEGVALAKKLNWKKGIGLSYNYLGWYYMHTGVHEKEIECYEQALKMYEEIDNKLYQAGVLSSIGRTHLRVGDYPKAIETAEKALELAREMKDDLRIKIAYDLFAVIEQQRSNFPKAIEYYLKSLEITKKMGDKAQEAALYGDIGIAYQQQSDYTRALEYHFKAQKIHEDVGNKAGIAATICNIGVIYSVQSDFNKGLEYYLEALKICEEIGHKEFTANICLNVAVIYAEHKNEYASALEYFNKSLKIYEELNNIHGIATAIGGIGFLYRQQKHYDLAADYIASALKVMQELGDRREAAIRMIFIGEIYLDLANDSVINQGDVISGIEPIAKKYVTDIPMPKGKNALLNKAINYALQAQKILTDVNDHGNLIGPYNILANAYALKGEYKKALDASDHYYANKDSVFSQENKEEILKMTMKNDYDRQRLTDSLKVAEKQKIAAINLKKQKSYTYMGVAGILLLVGFSFFIVKERSKSETARKQSDGLLLNILPEEVAEELKAAGTTTAKHFDNVTVLFTDFVNFTRAGESMSPQDLIDELHACFKKFDEISEKYNIEKIKTIGDAYLAVAGLPTADPNHAENIVNAAQDIVAFMDDRLAKMGTERTFQVRVGIHSGSVVAGIVGVKKFAYDIWGDTVNTAARMEQNSEAGKINISQTTYELVKDKFDCEYRGEVDAKGKGMMKMYYLSAGATA